ncbi:MAG TPA: hypothetical protein EYM76_02895 [Candidatus Marinimicrobia bacterium]|nr:hypothetical protein [Candidatus Neomarinimicrobiota bacterium]
MNFKAEKIISPANTKRMNSHLKINIIISLFIFSCTDDKIQIISNIPPDLPDQNYKINLKSNSGSFLANATIYWDATEGEVELKDTGVLINSSGNSHTFSGLYSGEFRDISIQVITVDSTYVDSIQIFTRPVYPVSNFWYEVETVMRGNGIWDEGESYTDLGNGIWDEGESYTDLGDGQWNEGEYFTDANANGIWDEGESYTDLGNGEWNEGEPYTDLSNGEWNEGEVFIDIKKPEYHRVLNWSTTAELDDNFTNYILYRVANNDADDLINSENCGCEIATLTKANTSFIDSTDLMVLDEWGTYAYFYQIRVISGSDGRNSYIYNYTDFTSLSKVSLVDANVSKNNSDFIQVTWEPVSNSTYFYQYEIWRASEDNSDNLQQMAIIINPDQGKFMDRAVGTGTTWYYSVAVVDINGNRKFSDFISGWSLP